MLNLRVDSLPSTSALTIKRLKQLDIQSYEDLLFHIPHRYEDRRTVRPIYGLQVDDHVCIQGIVKEIKQEQTKRFVKLQKALVVDQSGEIEVVWFNQPYIINVLKPNMEICIWGVCRIFGRARTFSPMEFEVIHPGVALKHTKQLIPIYPETRGLSSKTIREKIRYVLSLLADDEDAKEQLEMLPHELLQTYKLLRMHEALVQIHQPADPQEVQDARRRLGFDELFTIQLRSLLVKREWEQKECKAYALAPQKKNIDAFIANLPFTLTGSQQKAVDEICHDLERGICMNRFLQGDVGSGKTIVCAIAAYLVHLYGDATLIMAPTEILAQQHYQTLQKLFADTEVRVGLQTKSAKVADRKKGTDGGASDIIVGTHAILNEDYNTTVGLIVIDEQHRFGVKQRAALKSKGIQPHLLTMTATPIPRTAALALFGELEMSILNELPKDRLPIKSFIVGPEKRQDAYDWMRKQVAAGDQIYIICPLVEDSEHESMKDIKAATVEYERLQKEIFPDLRLGLLHGKMKAIEKQSVMQDFKDRNYDILVATSVVEVGIDVPNATIILIEAAERFGLAALHQLRGRVGRGAKQSYCLLFMGDEAGAPTARLKYFATHPNGIDIAQFDLEQRGAGDIYGTQQHGALSLKIAQLGDYELIHHAQEAAKTYTSHHNIADSARLSSKLEQMEVGRIAHD